MAETMIALKALYDLQDRLCEHLNGRYALAVSREVLDWAEAQGLLRDRAGRDVIAIEQRLLLPENLVLTPGRSAAIPSGPQARSADPAGDLNAVADEAETGPSPTGAPRDAALPASGARAPAPADAGAGAPLPEEPGKPGLAPRWTEEEDERAIAMRVAGAKIADIAAALGRTVNATTFRLYNVLKPRLAAALDACSVEPPPAAAFEPPPGEPAGEPRPEPAVPDLEAHLDARPMAGGWTDARDAELLRLAWLGWGIDDIAVELAIDRSAIKNRFAALTDDRRFARDDVRAALAARLPTAAE